MAGTSLSKAEIDARPWRQVRDWEGVEDKVLWEDPRTRSYAGLMRLAPGAKVPSHVHRYAVHHVLVLEGSYTVGGREMGPGSYSFVPAGVEHGVEEAGSRGCTLFYLYLRAEMD